MTRITVDLDDSLHKQLKIYCAENDVKVAVLIRELLAERFQQAKKKPKKRGGLK